MSPTTEWTPHPEHTRRRASWRATKRLAMALLAGCLGAAVGAAVGMLWRGW